MKNRTLLALLLIATSTLFSQTEKEKVESTVDKNQIEGHIYFLADDVLKGRATGSAENKIAASYLANTLRGYGVLPNPKTGDYYQKVNLQKTTPPSQSAISINNNTYDKIAILEANPLDFKGNAINVGFGLESDYKGKELINKMIIIKAGNTESQDARTAFGLRNEKIELAKKHGVIGIIELINTTEETWAYIDHNFNAESLTVLSKEEKEVINDKFVYTWVFDKKGALGTELESISEVPVSLMMSAIKTTPVGSQNVIGVVEGTDPKLKNEYIIYSAHYDHVGIGRADKTGDTIYNGARDNAVGATTVLSMAENLAKYPTKRSALFILFTGEEKGLLGSKFYTENPVIPLHQMVYCFNSDNGGYNDTSLATIVGLERTTASQNIKDAATTFGLTAIDDPAPEQGLFDRSDNVHFAKKGIPAPTFSMGFTSFDGEVTKYYHQPGDEADTLDYDYLLKFFQAYVLSGRNIANDPNTPFWTAGDKYEEKGKELYKINKLKN